MNTATDPAASRAIFDLTFQSINKQPCESSFDILVNCVREQHECQTIRQQSAESAHCAFEGTEGQIAHKLNSSGRVAPPAACRDMHGAIPTNNAQDR